MAKVTTVFLSRDVLQRGLEALQSAGVRDEQVEIREQRPKTGEAGFTYVDEGGGNVQASVAQAADDSMAALGDNLVGNPLAPTTDSRLGDLLAALAERDDGEERPEYEAGTRYEVVVETDEPDRIMRLLDAYGARDVRTRP